MFAVTGIESGGESVQRRRRLGAELQDIHPQLQRYSMPYRNQASLICYMRFGFFVQLPVMICLYITSSLVAAKVNVEKVKS